MKELIIFVGFIIAVIIFLNSLIGSQCANNVSEMGRNYRYDIVNGCRIQTSDGHYVYWKMFREFSSD